MPDELTIEPRKVQDMMQSGARFLLLDCREPWEFQAAHIIENPTGECHAQ